MNSKDHLTKALSLHAQGKKVQAAALYEQIIKKQPSNASALHYLGLIAYENEQLNKAKDYLEKSLELRPNHAVFHHNIAGFYSRMGNIEGAVSHFNKAVQLKPDYAEAYQGLTECTKITTDSDIAKLLSQQLERENLSASEKNFFHFSAGKIYADSGDYDQAFYHYSIGNENKNSVFDVDAYQRQIEEVKKVFNKESFIKRQNWGLNTHTPIFIIGMPRSGSSLTEQILSSHSEVFGAGELNDVSDIVKTLEAKLKVKYPSFLTNLTFSDATGYASTYVKRLASLSKNSRFVINKHPLNFRYLGLILLMFPNAKVIHTLRDPLDTCLSCYFQNFSNGQEYSFSLENLGHFYNGYRELMSHWDHLFKDKIFNLQYEQLVSTPEPVIKKLLDFLGLEWEESCLSHQNTSRPVATASKYQVRQPVYQSSVNRWKRYESHLEPLLAVINRS